MTNVTELPKVERLTDINRELGYAQALNDLNVAGLPLLVPRELGSEVLQLLMRNGFDASNDVKLCCLRVHRKDVA